MSAPELAFSLTCGNCGDKIQTFDLVELVMAWVEHVGASHNVTSLHRPTVDILR